MAGTGGRATRPRPEALATGALGFAFRAAQHEPGVRTILGRRYAQEGEEQAAAVIRDLCAHPSAARFVATKLVRHFVADEPPAAAVAAVAAEFTRSGGDLGRVARALIARPEPWEAERKKLRTPQDWVTATLRALGARQSPALARRAPPAALGAPRPQGMGRPRARLERPGFADEPRGAGAHDRRAGGGGRGPG